MAKKTAMYADYELRVEDNGKIVILNAGQAVQNAKGAIRTIASEIGFNVDPKWNTQSAGKKLVDFINSTTPATASTSKLDTTKVSAKSETEQIRKTTSELSEIISREPVKTGLPTDYKPSVEELQGYLAKWDTLNVYVEHEAALQMLFRDDPEFRRNTSLRHIIVKCAVLNDFYATNIYQIEPVARNIASISNFDERLARGDLSLVGEIAKADGVKNFNYSFATKYCSHHRPELFPIYDRYVADVLMFLHRKYPDILKFKSRESLKDYATFVGAIETVRQNFGLQSYTYKDIDRYLWQLGKDFYNPYVK